ncbi:MAG: DMT family transporter [Rhodobacteraceae bacterium]|nr:DMT family transporter [Paracoccaceae bacterium]
MDLWVIATLLAAIFQTARFMLHKVLSLGTLSPVGSTFARFAYAAPIAVGMMLGYLTATGASMPAVTTAFWAYAIWGGLGQAVATICVISLFSLRNFAVGLTLMKTETIMTAVVGMLVLGEALSGWGWGALVVGVAGVLLLSKPPKAANGSVLNRGLALGLASGVFFAFSSVGYRGASLEIAHADPFVRSSVTLALVATGQALGMALWLAWRDRGQLCATWAARRTGIWLGLSSAAGSLMWFTAFTLQTAAYVKALGQVELILSLAVSVYFFKETVTRRELAGIAVLTLGILLLARA